jgi:DNA repair exonuclease SbcCD nuclease subunit
MSKGKVFVIGDPHIRQKFMDDAEKLVSFTVALAKELKPDLIVCLGDILDTHEVVRTIPYKFACSFLEQLSEIAHTFLLIGNHDMINASQFLTDNHPFNPLKRVPRLHIVDKPVDATLKGMKFVFCPFVPPGRFIDALSVGNPDTQAYPIQWEDAQCIFAHQEFKGCHYGGVMESVSGDEWDKSKPPVISGHIHEEQHLKNGVHYVGTPIQHDYASGDVPEKFVWLVTFTKGKRFSKEDIEKHNLGIRGKKQLVLSIEEVEARQEEIMREQDDIRGNDIRLVVTGTKETIMAFRLSPLAKSFPGVKLCYKFDDSLDIIHDESMDAERPTFEDVFRRMVVENGDENVTRVLSLLS